MPRAASVAQASYSGRCATPADPGPDHLAVPSYRDVAQALCETAGRLGGIVLMTGSASANQGGAALAALAFPLLGPVGVVAVRQWVAGIVLLATVRH